MTIKEQLAGAVDGGPSLDLAVINPQNAVEIFTKGGMNAILEEVEAKVRAINLDGSTAPGREQIRSVAYKVTRTKTALDAEGKKLTEGWREATKKVNEERKRAELRLDALAEEVRRPLTEFENKEKNRVAAHEAALVDLTILRDHVAASPDLTVERLEAYQSDLAAMHPVRDWEEFTGRVDALRKELGETLTKRLEARRKYDHEQAELSRLRAEETARLQRERDERLKAEAAEKARLEAERKAAAEQAELKRAAEAAAEKIRLENERIRREDEARANEQLRKIEAKAREAEDARARQEKARIDAERRVKEAEQQRIDAAAKAERDRIAAAEQAKRDQEAAAKRERDRIAEEARKAESERAKRETNAKLRAKIRHEIESDLRSLVPGQEATASTVAEALLAGKIRHVVVNF